MSDASVNSKSVLLALAGDGGGVIAQRIQLLHRCNARLWAFEDEVRDPKLPHAEVVRLKRAIDRENLARHEAIASLDRCFDRRASPQRDPTDPDAVVDSRSLGEMVDRLSVLELKLAHHRDPARIASLGERRDRVCRCFDRVVEAMSRGDGLLQTFDEAKSYGR